MMIFSLASKKFRFAAWVFLAAAGLLICTDSQAQDSSRNTGQTEPKVNWQVGPATVKLGDQAQLDLPKGYVFADAANTRTFLEKTHNIPNGSELGTVAAIGDKWFGIFEFDPVGYVKDDEKDNLDANAILDNIKKATEAENEERKKRGWGSFTVTGWIDPPHYEAVSHQLTWSFNVQNENGVSSANYRTRLLGRRGVMSVELVTGPQNLNAALPSFRRAATDHFRFTPDNRYAAFVKGDKVAEYGLTALIVGGAAAAAVKTGLFKYLIKLMIVGWKLVVVGVGGLLAFLKKLFTGKKNAQQAAVSE